jgi:hypothetical protein
MLSFHGRARRVAVASSTDVDRECGVLHRLEEGPPDLVPLTEESPLRTKPQTKPFGERLRGSGRTPPREFNPHPFDYTTADAAIA